jgi:hypothetical protein
MNLLQAAYRYVDAAGFDIVEEGPEAFKALIGGDDAEQKARDTEYEINALCLDLHAEAVKRHRHYNQWFLLVMWRENWEASKRLSEELAAAEYRKTTPAPELKSNEIRRLGVLEKNAEAAMRTLESDAALVKYGLAAVSDGPLGSVTMITQGGLDARKFGWYVEVSDAKSDPLDPRD